MIAVLVCCFTSGASQAISRISIQAAQLNTTQFTATRTALSLNLQSDQHAALRLTAVDFQAPQGRWRDVELSCRSLQLHAARLACAQAQLRSEKTVLPLAFALTDAPRLELALKPQADELWQLNADLTGGALQGELKLSNAQLTRAAQWLGEDQPRPSSGRGDGTLALRQTKDGSLKLTGRLALAQLAFSDAAATRIGEGIVGRIELDATQTRAGVWQFRSNLAMNAGELLWTPLYLQQTPATLALQGTLQQGALREVQANAQLAGIGPINAKLSFTPQGARAGGSVEAIDIDLAGLYAALGKQLLEQAGGAQYEVRGRGSVRLRYDANGAQSAHINLRDATLADSNGRLRLSGINADVPWVNARSSLSVVRIASGELWRVPLANIEARATLRGYEATVPSLTVNVLDGIFALSDLQVRRRAQQWQWELTAGLTPVSLERLSKRLGWPQLSGSLSGVVPRMRYANDEIKVDGNVLFNVFGGNVIAQNLSMRAPLSAQPLVRGDVQMRALDLAALTRTYSFGHISGLIDVDVQGAELRNWRPVRFDARVASSAGDYPRRISQQAVQNLSSLGGAGATAALQRSLLRFFETFRYKRLGLSCVLRDTVCTMGGVAPAQRGYVIVEGGGIPAITVIGYNHQVGWEELLARIKRVTQGNAKAVVQ